jgi:hypothetical protein
MLALAGAYTLGVAWFSWRLRTDWRVQIPVLLCLLYNPYLFDPSSLYRLNPELANVFVMPVLLAIQPGLLPLVITSAVVCAWCFWTQREGRTELWAEKRPRWGLLLGVSAVAVSIAGWFVIAAPLVAGALGMMAATPAYSRVARWARWTLIVALWAIGIEFLFSMGLEPFAAIAEVNH